MHPFLANEFLIDWSRLRTECVEPDIREALRRARAAVETLKSLSENELSYHSVLEGFEAATRELSRAWGYVSHLDAVLNSPELRASYNALLPEVTAFFTSLTLDPDLWRVMKHYADTEDAKKLSGVRKRFLEETLADFRENGADLPEDKKAASGGECGVGGQNPEVLGERVGFHECVGVVRGGFRTAAGFA